jgi:predicted ATPase
LKIVRLKVGMWRNFKNVEIIVPKEATLVALIGENGVGKSSILDIINSAAHRLGLSAGVDIPRGDPFNDTHEFLVDAIISKDDRNLLTPHEVEDFANVGLIFDGGVSIHSILRNGERTVKTYLTKFSEHPQSHVYAERLIEALKQKEDTFHLSLDADRSYPPKPINANEFGQSLDLDWEAVGQRKHRAFSSSRSKYEEWMKYLVGTDAKKATEFFQSQRLAVAQNSPLPVFIDQFSSFSTSVKTVLPHLQFIGVDTKAKTILFDSSGSNLSFDKLSGGEREIAFVVGQIERFGLRNGMLLIDEPELHLNPEMVRNWVSYLRDTVNDGQTWIATHSMEAVEAAGLECTFVVQRDVETKQVRSVGTLADQHALSILSAAVGSPAFSLSKKKFIFIEGDRQGIERDKFYRICGAGIDHKNIRFMEGGGCQEVARKFDSCRTLADFADGQLRIGAIVDKDHRDLIAQEELVEKGMFVLPFHEIENAFLFPAAIDILIERAGGGQSGHDLIRKLSDKIAGRWIFNRARFRAGAVFNNLRILNVAWNAIEWNTISEKGIECTAGLVYEHGNQEAYEAFSVQLTAAIFEYSELRVSENLWKECEGKGVISLLPLELGYSKNIALINNVSNLLRDNKALIPPEFHKIYNYVEDH